MFFEWYEDCVRGKRTINVVWNLTCQNDHIVSPTSLPAFLFLDAFGYDDDSLLLVLLLTRPNRHLPVFSSQLKKCHSSYHQHCCCMNMRCRILVRYTVDVPLYHLYTYINWNQRPRTICTFAQSHQHRIWWHWKEGMQISAVNTSCNMSRCIR